MVVHIIGDRVQHETTGITGKVIGYGYRKVTESYYLTTLKVELFSYNSIRPIVEDLFERWQVLACSLPQSSNRILSKIS
ncbi:MAG: hypothetical protein RLZZ74_2420 [Cyanobacteriota bacterium]|jgi:hypothetical protein